MTTEQQNNVLLTIDPRKSRIRLYKTTLHALGDPKFIQFLISQKQRNFAIRAVDKEFTDAQPLKVNTKISPPTIHTKCFLQCLSISYAMF